MTAAAHRLLGEAAKDHPLADEDVVGRVLAGEKALYEVLMRRHNRKMYRVVRSMLRDEDDVEAVMQQAYVSAYLHLGQFRGGALFSTWLIRIAAHEALALIRRRERFEAEDGMDAVASRERSPEEAASDREVAAVLEAAIDRLPAPFRAAFVLRDVEGLDTAETARALGVSEENVKVRLHRARRRLRADLRARLGAGVGSVYTLHAVRCDRVVAAVFAVLEAREAR